MSASRIPSVTIRRGLCAAALLAGFAAAAPAHAEGVLNGETLRIIGLGDPVFQAMQKMTAEIEKGRGLTASASRRCS